MFFLLSKFFFRFILCILVPSDCCFLSFLVSFIYPLFTLLWFWCGKYCCYDHNRIIRISLSSRQFSYPILFKHALSNIVVEIMMVVVEVVRIFVCLSMCNMAKIVIFRRFAFLVLITYYIRHLCNSLNSFHVVYCSCGFYLFLSDWRWWIFRGFELSLENRGEFVADCSETAE